MSNDESFNDSDEVFSLYSSKNIKETFKAQLRKIVASSNHSTGVSPDVDNEELCSKIEENANEEIPVVANEKENTTRRTIIEFEDINNDNPLEDSIEIVNEFTRKPSRQSERLRKRRGNTSDMQVVGDNANRKGIKKTPEGRRRRNKNKQKRAKEIDEITLDDSPQAVENDDELNPEISVKVIWKSVNIKKFQIRKFQKLSHIFELLSQEEKVPEEKIILTFNNVQINRNDTPDSLNLQVYHFLDGGVLSEPINDCPTSNSHTSESQTNLIVIKFQDSNKKFVTLNLNKNDKIKVGMIKCSEQLEIPLNKMKFFFDGELIQPSDTVESLGLENGEIIDIKITES